MLREIMAQSDPSSDQSPDGEIRSWPRSSQHFAPGLYIVATPIGNLRDVTFRALDILAEADLVLAEDTRVSRRLFDAYGIKTRLTAYHEHNAESVRPMVLERLGQGARIALISDAGTPLVSDPGYRLVKDAAAQGSEVFPIPGPSALLAGLAVSGLPTDRFLFAGFPPPKSAARTRAFAELAAVPATLVFFESPSRLPDSLADMASVFGAREACVARELTKAFEEKRRAPLPDLAAHYAQAGPPKGEVVVLVGPPAADAGWDAVTLDAALRAALAGGSVKDAAAAVAAASGLPKRQVYARALELAAEAR